MLNKVAFRNTRKNFKEYAIYFFTLVFAVCIFYMFNSIDAQKEIMEVTSTTNSSMQALTKILSYISVFVSFILGFLIIYANNYFIKRRKKEIGIYQTLGMDKRKISLILVLETMLLAIFALFVGLCLGVFLSQFMSVFTAKIFEADLSAYKFIFSFTALIKSIIYFGIIFLIVIIFNVIIINKYKLIDLIYGSRKNEKLKIKNIKTSVFIFIISVICLATAYYMINARGLLQIDLIFLLNLIIGIVGTVLFFLSLTGFLIKVLQKKKKIYYKDLNMFVLRQINSKINTNFISMSVVCILLLLTIGILSCGISIENILSKDLKGMIKYDVTFMSNAKKISLKNNALDGNNSFYDTLPEDLKLEKYFKSKNEYITYNLKEYKYSDLNYINDKNESYLNDFKIDFLKLSDLIIY